MNCPTSQSLSLYDVSIRRSERNVLIGVGSEPCLCSPHTAPIARVERTLLCVHTREVSDNQKMGEFSNGLCGCFNNCTLCLITYVAPCYTAGKNAEAVGDSCMMVGALYAIFPIVGIYFAAKTREKVREQKGIDVSFLAIIAKTSACFIC